MKAIKLLMILVVAVSSLTTCKKIDPFYITKNIEPRDFLSNEKYKKLIIEIVYVDGHEPTQEAVNHITNSLNERLNKPGGIQISKKRIESPGLSSYSVTDIREIEEKHREYFPKKETISAFVFVCDAGYSGNSGNAKALGIAYDPTSFAIFEKTIMDYSGGIGEPSRFKLEATVMLHEFGHLLGLVNYGTSMTEHHQDVSNGHHCTEQSCIMYYTAETTDILGFLISGDVPGFDVKCIADMKNNGGK